MATVRNFEVISDRFVVETRNVDGRGHHKMVDDHSGSPIINATPRLTRRSSGTLVVNSSHKYDDDDDDDDDRSIGL
jgi:hypothetical protein